MIREHTCITVACDVCGQPLTDFEDEGTVHFASPAEARQLARNYRWNVLSGGEFVCPERDPEHQGFLDRLMPPEPVMPLPGQVGFDDTTP